MQIFGLAHPNFWIRLTSGLAHSDQTMSFSKLG